MAGFTSSEVSKMENDLHAAQEELQTLRMQVYQLTIERDKSVQELITSRAQTIEELTRATQLRTLLENMSNSLIAGISKIKDADETRRAQAQAREEAKRAPTEVRVQIEDHKPAVEEPKVLASVARRGFGQGPVTSSASARVRNDIVDDRLPTVHPAEQDDAVDLDELESVIKRGA